MVGEDDELEEYHLHGPSGAETRKISAVLVSPVVVLLLLQLQAGENSDGFFPDRSSGAMSTILPSVDALLGIRNTSANLREALPRCEIMWAVSHSTIGGLKNRLKISQSDLYHLSLTYHWLITDLSRSEKIPYRWTPVRRVRERRPLRPSKIMFPEITETSWITSDPRLSVAMETQGWCQIREVHSKNRKDPCAV